MHFRFYILMILVGACMHCFMHTKSAAAQNANVNDTIVQASKSSPTLAKKPPKNWRVERQAIERFFADDLQTIADWCRSKGLKALGEKTFAWHSQRDLNRQYIFLAPVTKMPTTVSDDENVKEWDTKIAAARRAHAKRIFDLAKTAANDGAGSDAFQLLHEVLFYDPDHEEVRRILGHRAIDDGWQVAPDKLTYKNATRRHKFMGWEPKTYLRVTTPHFEIASKASVKESLLLAQKLERWHGVWKQVCFEFWNKPVSVKRWIDGKGKAPSSRKKFKVVMFADEEQYASELENDVKGIRGSKGYYQDHSETSFVFASDEPQIQSTWCHEATHQWFQESITADKGPFDDGYLWLGEGIAMYFESITDFGPYVTLGGFESRRVQYARVRRLRENFYVPMRELAGLSRVEFQSHPDKGRLYSQSAGITHMLMNDNMGASQRPLIKFVSLLYRGKLKPGAFEKVLDRPLEDLDTQYAQFLAVDSTKLVEQFSQLETRTELALPDADLTKEAFDKIGGCRRLQWLDVTGSTITAEKLSALKNCDDLSQLFLTKCRIHNGSLAQVNQLKNLRELDLSGSSVNDSQLAALANTPSLSILRLVHTSISDGAVDRLAQIKGLTELDLTGTQVSPSGIARLKASLPNLNIEKK